MNKLKVKSFFQLTSLFLVGVFVLTSGFGCKLTDAKTQSKMQPITLNYWSLWDDADAFTDIIKDYQTLHPNITINYRKFRFDEYEQALLNAFAEDRGPDIYTIHNDWVQKYETKLAPMPSTIEMAYRFEEGTIQKQVIYRTVAKNSPTLLQLKTNYPDAVYKDILLNNQVYGLPLSVESLVLFYNKDIMNSANIAQPAFTWKDFQEHVTKMKQIDNKSNIIQAGTAMGTCTNVNRCFDVASIIMMQNMAQFGLSPIDENGSVNFTKNTINRSNPGLDAINFYLDFSNPVRAVYTWNKDMPNSLQAFYNGKVGYTFGYNYDIPTIRGQAPRLNFGTAKIPQIDAFYPVNYASYWLQSVAKKSKYPNEAWDFVIFSASEKEATKYLAKTNRPAALRSLLDSQTQNEDTVAAVGQTLSAKNWYTGKNPQAAESAYNEMIDNLVNLPMGEKFTLFIENALSKINQSLK